MEKTKIEWADHTFNPWVGCTRVSPGCDHCYAEADFDKRRHFAEWGAGNPRVRTSPANWRKPLAWDKAHAEFFAQHGLRQRVFCASLADVFDNEVPVQWRADLFSLIAATPNLDWLLLTKRIGNVMPMLRELRHGSDQDLTLADMMPLPNVWIGVTVVNQAEADRDIPKLLSVPAALRFLSIEPMLGPVSLAGFDGKTYRPWLDYHAWKTEIDWVICGGESGPNARPMHPDWARSLRDQCAAAGVPFLFKQWGEWTPEDWGERPGLRDTAGVLPSGEYLLMSKGYVPPFDTTERLNAAGNVRLDGRMLMDRVGKKAAGRLLDGVEHNGIPSEKHCWCHTCRPVTLDDMRMIVCPDCGNKRCPKANDHRNACTNSNDLGQDGSAY